jgi:hypothetical protein
LFYYGLAVQTKIENKNYSTQIYYNYSNKCNGKKIPAEVFSYSWGENIEQARIRGENVEQVRIRGENVEQARIRGEKMHKEYIVLFLPVYYGPHK